MDLYALYRTEENPVYRMVETANFVRYSGFLETMIVSAVMSDQRKLTEPLIKAINFHAIVGLHPDAGQYRSVPVYVGDYTPPPFDQVPSLMEEMVNTVNEYWDEWPATHLASYGLWEINKIHPFVNGNGRTARAACYFIMCVKSGGLLPGRPSLPEVLREEPIRSEYVAALKVADGGDLGVLIGLVERLMIEQLERL